MHVLLHEQRVAPHGMLALTTGVDAVACRTGGFQLPSLCSGKFTVNYNS